MGKGKVSWNWKVLKSEGYSITPAVTENNNTLSRREKDVLNYLMNLSTNNVDVHPGYDTIGKSTSQSSRSVMRAVETLTRLGLIKIVQRGNGRGYSNSYEINVRRINEFFGYELLNDDSNPHPADNTSPKTTPPVKKHGTVRDNPMYTDVIRSNN